MCPLTPSSFWLEDSRVVGGWQLARGEERAPVDACSTPGRAVQRVHCMLNPLINTSTCSVHVRVYVVRGIHVYDGIWQRNSPLERVQCHGVGRDLRPRSRGRSCLPLHVELLHSVPSYTLASVAWLRRSLSRDVYTSDSSARSW